VQHALAAARARGVPTVLNPAPVQAIPDEVWPLVDYLTPNEGEAAQLSGLGVGTLDEARVAGHVLVARGCRTVIVTLGEQGALACGASSRAARPRPRYHGRRRRVQRGPGGGHRARAVVGGHSPLCGGRGRADLHPAGRPELAAEG
jgi:sugar/nucleoside kinase (ribokinase family)